MIKISLPEVSSPKMLRSICAPYDPSEKIFVSNPELVRSKITKIRQDGAKNLSIITGIFDNFELVKRF